MTQCQQFPCSCGGHGDRAVEQNQQTGRWFITMGHCGFNTRANNAGGYATEQAARQVILRHEARSGPKTRRMFSRGGCARVGQVR